MNYTRYYSKMEFCGLLTHQKLILRYQLFLYFGKGLLAKDVYRNVASSSVNYKEIEAFRNATHSLYRLMKNSIITHHLCPLACLTMTSLPAD